MIRILELAGRLAVVALLSLAARLAGAADGVTMRTTVATTEGQRAVYCPATGMLYYTQGTGGAGNLLYRVNITGNATGTPRLLAGQATAGTQDGVGTLALLQNNYGSIVLNEMCTTLYMADNGGSNLRKVRLSDVTVSTLAGGTSAATGADGTGTNAYMWRPRGTVLSRDGRTLYFTTENAVRKMDLSSNLVTTIAGDADDSRYGSADGVGSAATFWAPSGIAVLDDDTLLVVEENNHLLRRVALSTRQVTTLVGSALDNAGTDGVGLAARLDHPMGIYYYAPRDTLYIVQQGLSTIRKVNMATLQVSSFALSGDFTADGMGAAGLYDIALDPGSNRAFAITPSAGSAARVYIMQLDLTPIARAASGSSACAAGGGCLRLGAGAALVVQAGGTLVVGGGS